MPPQVGANRFGLACEQEKEGRVPVEAAVGGRGVSTRAAVRNPPARDYLLAHSLVHAVLVPNA